MIPPHILPAPAPQHPQFSIGTQTRRFLFLFLLVLASMGRSAFATGEIATYNFGTSCIIRDDTRDRVYCTVPSLNSVSIIDSSTLQVTATVFVGSNPSSLSVSPDGSVLYVGLSGSSSPGIVVLDLTSLSVVRSINTGAAVRSVVAGTNTLYTLEGSAILAYDATNGTVRSGSLSTYQGGVTVYGGIMKLSPDGKTLYYYQSGLSPSTWYRIDVTSWPGTAVQNAQWGSNGQDMALSADGKWITFASGAPYSVRKLQASDPTVSAGQMDTGAYPHAVTYSQDGNTIYTNHTSGRIDVWNANTFVQLTPITTTGQPDALKVDRTGQVLFAGTSTAIRAYYIGAASGGTLTAQITQAVEITWNSTYGSLYQVQWSSSPNGPNWFNLGGQILGTGLSMSVYDSCKNTSSKFYRVSLVTP